MQLCMPIGHESTKRAVAQRRERLYRLYGVSSRSLEAFHKLLLHREWLSRHHYPDHH